MPELSLTRTFLVLRYFNDVKTASCSTVCLQRVISLKQSLINANNKNEKKSTDATAASPGGQWCRLAPPLEVCVFKKKP